MTDRGNDTWGGITADELREAWDSRLRPIPDDLIAAAVSPVTRSLLTEVGLPTVEVLGVSFVSGSGLSNVERHAGNEYLVVTDAMPYMAYAIDVDTDEVVEFDRRDPAGTRFVNSDLATLILYLGQVWRAASLTEAAAAKAAFAEIRESLSLLDPVAVEEGAPWWLLLDELESNAE
ncbi:SUKH-4 family immunity protein [Amycolatopsis sp. cmx-8-4]|uniref:SUKH-4 family immunity protein n=1 Tax=Amycolatopsis sp. cmx-8-4 TaxID=2790947 RepID=UPI00397D34CA